MKQAICVFFAVLLFLLTAPEADAVTEPKCRRYDIWSKSYVDVSDFRYGKDRMDNKDCIVPFETCVQRCFVEDDLDGICDDRENCDRKVGTACGIDFLDGIHGGRGRGRTGFRGGK